MMTGRPCPPEPGGGRCRTQGVRFKSAALNWVGRVDSQIDVLFMAAKSPIKSISDAQKKRNPPSRRREPVRLRRTIRPCLNNLVGTKFKIVLGYRGSNDAMLALERGEPEPCAENS